MRGCAWLSVKGVLKTSGIVSAHSAFQLINLFGGCPWVWWLLTVLTNFDNVHSFDAKLLTPGDLFHIQLTIHVFAGVSFCHAPHFPHNQKQQSKNYYLFRKIPFELLIFSLDSALLKTTLVNSNEAIHICNCSSKYFFR